MINKNIEEQQYVNQQSLVLLVSSLTKAIYAFPITASILTFIFWSYVEHSIILLWLFCVYCVSVIRFVVHKNIKQKSGIFAEYSFWLKTMLAIDFSSGFILGMSGYFITVLPQELQLLVVIVAAAISMESIGAQSAIKSSFASFNIPLFVTFSFWLFIAGSATHFVLIALILVHGVFLFGNFKAMHEHIRKGFKLTFSNQKLANDLAKKNIELEKSNQQVKATSMAKSQFIAQLSHQLKDPLQSIIEKLNISEQPTNVTEIQTLVKAVQTSGVSLLTLLNDLIDVHRLEKGLLAKIDQSIDVRKHFDDLAQLIALNAENKNLFFYCDIADDVPSKVISDPLRLSQITLNLLANAIKFTEKGEVGLSLTYQITNNEAWLTITVIDTGQGIDEEKQNYIFQHFVQGESSIDAVGNGLGLSISQELAQLLGGNISVISSPDKGSIFSCKVPVQLGAEKEMVAKYSKQKILLIEGNVRQRQAMIHQFNYLKKSFEIAENAKEAMAICASHNSKYQIVIIGHQDKLQQKLLLNLCARIKLPTLVLKSLSEKHPALGDNSNTLNYPIKLSDLLRVLE